MHKNKAKYFVAHSVDRLYDTQTLQKKNVLVIVGNLKSVNIFCYIFD